MLLCCVRMDDMDDSSCVIEYIEIVPCERNEDCSDVKCEPVTVKVGVVSVFISLFGLHAHFAGILFCIEFVL